VFSRKADVRARLAAALEALTTTVAVTNHAG
jgi:hypothetical protein